MAAGIGCANTGVVVAASKLEGPADIFLVDGARKDSGNAHLSEGSSNSNVCNLHSNRVYKKNMRWMLSACENRQCLQIPERYE